MSSLLEIKLPGKISQTRGRDILDLCDCCSVLLQPCSLVIAWKVLIIYVAFKPFARFRRVRIVTNRLINTLTFSTVLDDRILVFPALYCSLHTFWPIFEKEECLAYHLSGENLEYWRIFYALVSDWPFL